ncbi:MAG: alpha-L-fucosidase [Candidatus Coatesbacteria bacterium]
MSAAGGFPQRHVHLDFHTSPHIPDVGAEFDARGFARTMKDARVDAVNIFAKCHHGMCYWPAKTGTPHPALHGRDLLGEQVEALHREGIRCPIYFTVGWEEDAAHAHPAWRQARADGSNPRAGTHPGAWWFMNFLHPAYLDYMEAQVREITARYAVDGFWYDIVFFDGAACWSEETMKFREARGLMGTDDATRARFQTAAKEAFAARFSRLVRDAHPAATVFFNGTTETYTDSDLGCRAVVPHETHLEIESLPSGFWGYHHFPRLARAFAGWGKPWVGMTGRFQRAWGDFGGIKPQAALEYECFRTQALGGANSVGDQLPPRGTLEPAAYRLIGAVYEQCETAEPFYAGSVAIPELAIVNPNATAGTSGSSPDLALEGAVSICEEGHRDCAVVDDADDLAGYGLVILPDGVRPTPKLAAKLAAYVAAGGRLVVSHRSGFDAAGAWALPFLPLAFSGETDRWPNYWRARPGFSPAHAGSDRVCYSRGMNVKPGPGLEVLVDRVQPYFQRTEEHFSSHAQTPPESQPAKNPAIVAGKEVVYLADPVFTEYRQTGNLAARDFVRLAMDRLAGPAPFGAGLPTTVGVYPRRRGHDLLLTLLHYVPVRKAIEIDVIEERMGFTGLSLRLPPAVASVRVFGSGESLPRNPDGSFALPASSGRLLLEVPGFFR